MKVGYRNEDSESLLGYGLEIHFLDQYLGEGLESRINDKKWIYRLYEGDFKPQFFYGKNQFTGY